MKCMRISKEGGSYMYVDFCELNYDTIIASCLEQMELGDVFIFEAVNIPEEDYKSLPEFDGDW